MQCKYACGSADHTLSRRSFLAGISAGTAGVLGFNHLIQPATAKALAKTDKRVLVIWLSGGVSQLETWDPKPGTNTGGPFQTIATSVPGVHICELLPYTAQWMHKMAPGPRHQHRRGRSRQGCGHHAHRPAAGARP